MFAGAPLTTSVTPGIGSLLGGAGSQALLDDINNSSGSATFFGTIRDAYATVNNTFIQNIIQPIRQTAALIANTVQTYMQPDVIRALRAIDDFQRIPPSMHMAIVMYQPVRELLEQGRITGFGLNPDYLPEEDAIGRLISNNVIDDIGKAERDEHGRVTFLSIQDSTDPVYSDKELEDFRVSRMVIDQIMADTRLDPTDITEERG